MLKEKNRKQREEQKYAIKFVFIDVAYVTQHYCMAWQNPGFRLVDVRSVKNCIRIVVHIFPYSDRVIIIALKIFTYYTYKIFLCFYLKGSDDEKDTRRQATVSKKRY